MIFIIIPFHDRLNHTKQCLYSLHEQIYTDFHVIAIDDGSTDGTAEMIQRDFPEVILLKGDGDLWWTKAVNLGIQYALEKGTDYILTLNNDTIACPDYLEKMLYRGLRTPDAVLSSLGIDAETGEIAGGGSVMNWWKADSEKVHEKLADDEKTGLHKVSHAPGRGLFIPAEILRQVGLFDEKTFPHYGADYDFSMRCRKAGYEVFINYNARLKVFPKESGDYHNRTQKNLRNYLHHLFGIKGGGNLKVFYHLAMRHCPKSRLPVHLPVGIARRLLGYWMR